MTTTLALAHRQVRQLRSAVDELLVGPKTRLLEPLLPKALQHLADAQKIAARLPDSLAAPEEHDVSVRDMDAHALAAHRYLEAYRGAIPPATPNDPEGETDPSPAAENARAFAKAVAAGFGRAPKRRRH
jgi:hypothetical protein